MSFWYPCGCWRDQARMLHVRCEDHRDQLMLPEEPEDQDNDIGRGDGMKALSIRQPWAWLIVNGHKDLENRDWPTKFRGRVYVHTGLKIETDDFPELRRVAHLRGFDLPGPGEVAVGAIVGEVDIVGCVTESNSPWFVGPYGFILADPQAYSQPVPCKGRLGFFEPNL